VVCYRRAHELRLVRLGECSGGITEIETAPTTSTSLYLGKDICGSLRDCKRATREFNSKTTARKKSAVVLLFWVHVVPWLRERRDASDVHSRNEEVDVVGAFVSNN
jgi:hypothetical protein